MTTPEQLIRSVQDVVNTGDLVKDGGSAEAWERLFAVEQPLARDRVIYPALGNHDVKSGGRRVDPSERFALPGGGDELYYAFTYARSRLIVLDSNSRGSSLAASARPISPRRRRCSPSAKAWSSARAS